MMAASALAGALNECLGVQHARMHHAWVFACISRSTYFDKCQFSTVQSGIEGDIVHEKPIYKRKCSRQPAVIRLFAMAKRRVGIVGAGALGQYLIEAIVNDAKTSAAFEIAFVWNRSFEKVASNPLIPEEAKYVPAGCRAPSVLADSSVHCLPQCSFFHS